MNWVKREIAATATFVVVTTLVALLALATSASAHELSTTLAGGNGADGNMFDLTAVEDITITDFEVHAWAAVGDVVDIEVYYVSNRTSYVGNEGTADNWTLLGSASVTSNGQGVRTPTGIGGLTLIAGETVGIYVTRTGGSLRYTNGPLGGYASHELIFEDSGVGLTYPFSTVFGSRVWNGTIVYEPASVLETTLAAGNNQNGSMFDLTAVETLEISDFEVNMGPAAGTSVEVEVYYVTDHTTYVGKEGDSGSWTLLASATVASQGAGVPTPIGIGGLRLVKGETVGIYVTLKSGLINYTNGLLGEFSTPELTFEDRGLGVEYPFGTTYNPRIWNGRIVYKSFKMLSTLVDGGAGANGNMFDLTAVEDIQVTDFEAHIAGSPGDSVEIEVYYVKDFTSYVGKEGNSGAWKMLGSATVTSKGTGALTPIGIGGLTIYAGETVGIYVTRTSGILTYNHGLLGAYSTPELIFEDRGLGLQYPFGSTFDPRVWNGNVLYEPAPILKTTFAGGNGWGGNMFDLRVNHALEITDFEINLEGNPGDNATIEVYYVTDRTSYIGNEKDSGAWTLLRSNDVVSQGVGNPTSTRIGGLKLQPGEVVGIYVTRTSGNLKYTNGPLGEFSTKDLVMEDHGLGVGYPFGSNASSRVWNGNILYAPEPDQLLLSVAALLTTVMLSKRRVR